MYNNVKNINIAYTLFEFNCKYYFCISYKKNINFWSKFKAVNKMLAKFQEFISIYYNNLFQSQKLQK